MNADGGWVLFTHAAQQYIITDLEKRLWDTKTSHRRYRAWVQGGGIVLVTVFWLFLVAIECGAIKIMWAGF